ncbi:uncharacterized protein N7515_000500 [Penicillium bovifimosum]|uniref:Uncharacterized protein n=1 Tax=Penicillium bovifimosum TaxID=126998 RepID=A0A9W9HFQ2_9EURO|nr:uncharacterized protein N7515_000500 [Penicillium bovifimosum]KAJ5145936.1 hypothetical protein N7515_000500 [Penicillium bovifimosum]
MAMEIRPADRRWAMATTYRPAAHKGKQADQCFTPPCRSGSPRQPVGWPTFVIETGLSESLPRLREDARWWFNNSPTKTAGRQALRPAVRPFRPAATNKLLSLSSLQNQSPMTEHDNGHLMGHGSIPQRDKRGSWCEEVTCPD